MMSVTSLTSLSWLSRAIISVILLCGIGTSCAAHISTDVSQTAMSKKDVITPAATGVNPPSAEVKPGTVGAKDENEGAKKDEKKVEREVEKKDDKNGLPVQTPGSIGTGDKTGNNKTEFKENKENKENIENKENKENKEVTGNKTGANAVAESPLNDSISFVKYVMSLAFVLGLILLSAYLYKKLVGIKSSGFRKNMVPMSIVGTMPLGEKKFLVIIEIQDKHYFLGVTPSSINLLSSLELDLSQVNREEGNGNDFEVILSKARALLQNRGKK